MRDLLCVCVCMIARQNHPIVHIKVNTGVPKDV
jgi:hypothetical protein